MSLNITPGLVFAIIALAHDSMVKNGILDATGAFVNQGAALESEELAMVTADVEAALKAKGLGVPSKLDKIIQAIPSIAQILTVTLAA